MVTFHGGVSGWLNSKDEFKNILPPFLSLSLSLKILPRECILIIRDI